MKKIFCPSDYLALPDCLEKEVVELAPHFSVPVDLTAIKANKLLLSQYFSTLPKYESWIDFLPSVEGNEVLARLAVIIGDRVGAWEIEKGPASYAYPKIRYAEKFPKPSRGDLKEEPAFSEQDGEDGLIEET